MKIMWASNFSAQSAYAQQTHLFVPKLRAAGHDMLIFELSNGVSKPYDHGGIPVLGVGYDALGNDMITEYVRHHQIDAVITLVDVWRFQPDVWKDVPWFPWTPIDHKPVPPHVATPLKSARRIIAMSRYGQDELTDAGFSDVLYVPHAVDPEVFHPRTEAERSAARKAIGVTDSQFLVTFVGVNDSVPANRKGIPEMLMAWKYFSDMHPDAVLYMHTMMHGNLPVNSIGGVKIDTIVNTLNIRGDSIRMVDQHRYKASVISQNEIAGLMAAANVQIMLSRGEGFGLAHIEACRCGTPMITTNFAAGSRLLMAGWHVDYEAEWSWQDAFWAKPGVMSALEALENAYAARDDERLRKLAEINATEFDIDNVMQKYMLPTLHKIAEEVLERAAA